MESTTLANGLPQINRFITDHTPEGKACFSTRNDEVLEWQPIQHGTANFALGYTTSRFPVNLNKEQDISDYEDYLKSKPGLTIPGGTVLRFVDISPGFTSPMHRTVSMDYGVVIEGQVELILDSGEKRILNRGDICVQRGTNHAWRNTNPTQWARMMYVLQECEPFTVDGKALGEDYGNGMDGVRPSGSSAA